MTIKDRTTEFLSLVEVAKRRDAKLATQPSVENSKSEFGRLSAEVGRGIRETTEKLATLTKLAKTRDLFEDKTTQIQELTFLIGQDIKTLQHKIGALQEIVHQKRINPQYQKHSEHVIDTLNIKLKNTVSEFKDALELRNENLKVQQETKKAFTGTGSLIRRSDLQRPSFAPESWGKSDGGDVAINIGGAQSMLQLQQTQQYNHASDRVQTVETIRKTIVELDQIFQQITTIVAEHEQLVLRIDDNVSETLSNTISAEKELSKYVESISSNRWLMIKVFGVLILFIILFVVFFV